SLGRRSWWTVAWYARCYRESRPRTEYTEAEAGQARVGRVEVALRRPAVAGEGAPATASVYPVRVARGPLRVGNLVHLVGTVPVLDPFPDIAVHVIQTPGVRLALPHRMRSARGVVAIPGIVPQLARLVTKAIGRSRPGARGVLPLCLGGQAIGG